MTIYFDVMPERDWWKEHIPNKLGADNARLKINIQRHDSKGIGTWGSITVYRKFDPDLYAYCAMLEHHKTYKAEDGDYILELIEKREKEEHDQSMAEHEAYMRWEANEEAKEEARLEARRG